MIGSSRSTTEQFETTPDPDDPDFLWKAVGNNNNQKLNLSIFNSLGQCLGSNYNQSDVGQLRSLMESRFELLYVRYTVGDKTYFKVIATNRLP